MKFPELGKLKFSGYDYEIASLSSSFELFTFAFGSESVIKFITHTVHAVTHVALHAVHVHLR